MMAELIWSSERPKVVGRWLIGNAGETPDVRFRNAWTIYVDESRLELIAHSQQDATKGFLFAGPVPEPLEPS